jgi:hypothetical protein
MAIKNRIVGIAFSVSLVVTLALPALRWLQLRVPDGALYGYSDSLPPPPQNPMRAFFDKSLQHWIEKNFEKNLGFRALLIRSFNELNFRLFREAPKLRLYTTPTHGLYSKMSIESLNDEVVRRKVLEDRYRIEAEKLLRVQRHLQSQGKYFGVIISTSKPYVYPSGLGSRYLVGGDFGIFDRAANFGNVLSAAGVNVIDGGPLLRKFAAKTGVETHPDSGVHWNYYAGCLIAHELLDNVRNRQFAKTPILDCGEPHLAKPQNVDVDGLLLLNIMTNGGLVKPTPYPTISTSGDSDWRPNIVFIGDSFSDQIVYALQQGNVYSRMVRSAYFKVRAIDDKGNNKQSTDSVETDFNITRSKLMSNISSSDIVILQMVDYNVSRWGYEFPDYFLKHYSK